jgi:YidC/Oxa1 family membrane protein insertase
MDQQRNLILAIVLSAAILFGFQYFFQRQAPPHPAQTTTQGEAPTAPGSATAPGTATAPTATAAPTVALPRAEALAAAARVKIETPRLNGSINLVGARFDDLTLVNYHETTDPKSAEIELLSPSGAEHPYFAQFGWTAADAGTKIPDDETRWTTSDATLTPAHPVELAWDNGQGLRFVRHYAVDDNFMFTVTQTVTNSGDKPVTLYPYGLVQRTGTPPVAGTYLLHEGPIGVFNGSLQDGIGYGDLKPGADRVFATTGGWLGITDKYWLVALIPDQNATEKARFQHAQRDHAEIYQADYTGAEQTVPPGGSVTSGDRLFAGAKEVHLLSRYRDDEGIPLFDYAIDFGLFFFLTRPIFLALDFLNHWVGNFGIAILRLTVSIKLIFFPLQSKSYRAMSKMKLLQPEIAKLRERFGEDKQRLNQEMMALYKRVGANPMAGCLPIVVQIPVFFSLYKVLYVTIEMRHAPFYGWIHDLSAPDPTSFVNLFGLLPFVPPDISFLTIGAWPLIMGVTMFLQQKLNPQPPDPIQAKMFMVLPFVFTYMLAHFAAGLVIYWAWNNSLSIAQQWVIMRRARAA